MRSIFFAQWMKEKRSPYLVLIFCALSIIAPLLFGANADTKIKVDVFRGEGIAIKEAEDWVERLNEKGSFTFMIRSEEKAILDVRQGRSEMAVKLLKDDYRVITVKEEGNVDFVQQHLQTVYTDELKIKAAAQHSGDEQKFRESMANYLNQPPVMLQSATPSGGELKSYDMQLQLIFGFTLFLAMFTVGFKIIAVPAEKVSGIWNRVILSPTTKVQMYMGHLTYSTLIGIVQISLLFITFKYVLGYTLGVSFTFLAVIIVLYIVSVVAMCMLFAGLFKLPEQYMGFLTSVGPMMPLVSGVYMPPGTITSEVLLLIGQFFPIKHAMDALIGVSMYQYGWEDIYLPLAKILLLTVIFFGVGINLIERRKS